MMVDLAARAEAVLADRRRRDAVFHGDLDGFGEPAWDFLLALFIAAEQDRGPIGDDELLAAIAMPADLARPYLLWLKSHDLTRFDGKLSEIAPRGRAMMIEYLEGAGNGERTD